MYAATNRSVHGVMRPGALPPLIRFTTVYSALPSEASQKPGCSAADMNPTGRLFSRKLFHCLSRIAVSGMSIQMKMNCAFSFLDFSSPGAKSVAPVG